MQTAIGPIIGAVIAGLFAIVGLVVGASRERTKWTREARHIAYRDFLGAVDALAAETVFAKTNAEQDVAKTLEQILGPKVAEMTQKAIAKRSDVMILGPNNMIALADVLLSQTLQQLHPGTDSKAAERLRTTRQEFATAAQEELKLS